MPWKATCAMDERVAFVMACQAAEASLTTLSRRFGISRRTAYKWLDRFEAEGWDGLKDRSRAPRTHPNQISPEVEATVVAMRYRHPHWGARKIRAFLQQEEPAVVWPASSTLGDALRRYGLTVPRRRRRRTPPYEEPFAACDGPNAVWGADFKGRFLTGDGSRCEPLTITDAYSRYLLRCVGQKTPRLAATRAVFETAFREFGLPRAIRTDNGVPFASCGVRGLSQLSVWWIKLGIVPERIAPGEPQQNGRHERMHRTLKAETTRPPAWTLAGQQRRLEAFRREYNELRPHEALGQRPPASVYRASPRAYPDHLPEITYACGMSVRRVRTNGEFVWRHRPVYLSKALVGEAVGLTPLDDRYWLVNFSWLSLGVLDASSIRLLTERELISTGWAADERWRSPFRYAPGAPPAFWLH